MPDEVGIFAARIIDDVGSPSDGWTGIGGRAAWHLVGPLVGEAELITRAPGFVFGEEGDGAFQLVDVFGFSFTLVNEGFSEQDGPLIVPFEISDGCESSCGFMVVTITTNQPPTCLGTGDPVLENEEPVLDPDGLPVFDEPFLGGSICFDGVFLIAATAQAAAQATAPKASTAPSTA